MKATQQLKDDHEKIKVMLLIMEKINRQLVSGKKLDVEQYERIIDFIKVFADQGHHAKEEDLLFPAMESKGFSHDNGPVAVMLDEHRIGRDHIKALGDAVAQYKSGNTEVTENIIAHSGDYVALLRNHIDKEDNILFTMADKVVSETEQEKLFETFEKLKEEKIGRSKYEEYYKLIHELAIIYL